MDELFVFYNSLITTFFASASGFDKSMRCILFTFVAILVDGGHDPVLPKPPSPRSDSSKLSTSINSTSGNLRITS